MPGAAIDGQGLRRAGGVAVTSSESPATDSPKGPEREARPGEVSLPELRYAPNGRVAVRRPGQFDEWVVVAGPDLSWLADVRPNADDVEAWPALPSPAEVERLTAEVERLRSERRGLAETAGALIRRMNNAEAEVSRLREQLATAVFVWPRDAMVRIRECIADPSRMGPRQHQSAGEPYETVAGWGARAVVKLMESWRAPGAESVPAAPELQATSKLDQNLEMEPSQWSAGDFALDCTNFVWRRDAEGFRPVRNVSGVQYRDADVERLAGPLVRLLAVPEETDHLGSVPAIVADRLRADAAAEKGGS